MTTCVLVAGVLLAYLGWLARVCAAAAAKARQREAVIAQQEEALRQQAEALRRAQRQLEAVLEYEAHRPLPEPIRSVALSYAAKAKN